MTEPRQNRKQGRPEPLARMIGKVLDPVCAKRGLSQAALLASWPEIIGPRYADCTAPDRIIWPRRRDAAEIPGGTLVLRVDGGRAIYLQHELGQVIDRVNAFLGFNAVARVKIVQMPVARATQPVVRPKPMLSPAMSADLDLALAGIASPDLRNALRDLGTAVLGQPTAGQSEETP